MTEVPSKATIPSHSFNFSQALPVDNDWQLSLKSLDDMSGDPLGVHSVQTVKLPSFAWKAMQREKQYTVHGYTLTVKGYVGRHTLTMLLDTGAANTIISSRILALIPDERKPFPVLPFNYKYASVSPGNNLEAQGLILLPIKIGSHVITVTCVIADIDCPMILGADFIVESEASICFRRKTGTMYFKA